MKLGIALYAVTNFLLTSMLKKGLVRLHARENLSQKTRVYNITVDNAHCYYANGILVSNCESLQYLMLGAGEGRAIIKAPEQKRKPKRLYDARVI